MVHPWGVADQALWTSPTVETKVIPFPERRQLAGRPEPVLWRLPASIYVLTPCLTAGPIAACISAVLAQRMNTIFTRRLPQSASRPSVSLEVACTELTAVVRLVVDTVVGFNCQQPLADKAQQHCPNSGQQCIASLIRIPWCCTIQHTLYQTEQYYH